MKFKNKKNRFSDLMVGDTPANDTSHATQHNRKPATTDTGTLPRASAETVPDETPVEAEKKPSFLDRMKATVATFLKNAAERRELRKLARDEKRELKALEKAEKKAEAEKLAAEKLAAEQKPVTFPDEISTKNIAKPDTSQAPPTPAPDDLSDAPQPCAEGGRRLWPACLDTRSARWILTGGAVLTVLGVLAVFTLPGILFPESQPPEIAENSASTTLSVPPSVETPETVPSRISDDAQKPAAKPNSGHQKQPEPDRAAPSLDETFSAFPDTTTLPDFPAMNDTAEYAGETAGETAEPSLSLPEVSDIPDIDSTAALPSDLLLDAPTDLAADTPAFAGMDTISDTYSGPHTEPGLMPEIVPETPPTPEFPVAEPSRAGVPQVKEAEPMEPIQLSSLPRSKDFMESKAPPTLADTLAASPHISPDGILAPKGFVPEEEMKQNSSLGTYLSSEQEKLQHTHTHVEAYANRENKAGSAGHGKISGDFVYVVRQGDNYLGISEKVYGTGSYSQAIARYNNNMFVDRQTLPVGHKLYIPERTFLEKHYPSLCPAKGAQGQLADTGDRTLSLPKTEYVVRSGDSLADIAHRELGSASRWVELYRLNRDVLQDEYHALPAGVRLRLPEGVSPGGGVIATRPEEGRNVPY